MSWINIDLNEIEKEERKTSGIVQPGTYKGTIKNIYVSDTQGGTQYFGLELDTSDREIKLNGFSVERMIKNRDGNTKTSNGRYFTGIILLNKIAKCFNLTINDLTPTQKIVEIFGRNETVGVFNQLLNKQITIGVRHKIREYEGEKKTNIELVDICCVDDNECVEKLKKRIEKKPIIDETTKETKKEDDIEVPF